MASFDLFSLMEEEKESLKKKEPVKENPCCVEPGEENPCALEQEERKSVKKGKKDSKSSSNSKTTSPAEQAIKKLKEIKLPSRVIDVKIYNERYTFEAPEGLEKPTLEDVRLFMVKEYGYTELTPERANIFIVEPQENEEKYVYCNVKAEKMG